MREAYHPLSTHILMLYWTHPREVQCLTERKRDGNIYFQYPPSKNVINEWANPDSSFFKFCSSRLHVFACTKLRKLPKKIRICNLNQTTHKLSLSILTKSVVLFSYRGLRLKIRTYIISARIVIVGCTRRGNGSESEIGKSLCHIFFLKTIIMDMGGAYGGGKAGGAFNPITFVQRPQVLLRAACWVSDNWFINVYLFPHHCVS